MFVTTFRYQTGRIHLTHGSEDFAHCADVLSHISVRREELSFFAQEIMGAIRADSIAMEQVRRFAAKVGDERALIRFSDAKTLDYVSQLLTRGYLRAVACGFVGSPFLTSSREKPRIHVRSSSLTPLPCANAHNHQPVDARDEAAVKRFLSILLQSPESVNELREAAFAEPELSDLRRTTDDQQLAEALMPLIVSGRFKLVTCGAFGTRTGRVSGGQPAEAEEKAPPRGRADRDTGGSTATAPPPEPPKPVEKTWFRAKLVDEEGQPMAGEDYVLVTSDGANRKGKLDANGEVYIPPILPPGDCTISFPNIHLNPLKRKK